MAFFIHHSVLFTPVDLSFFNDAHAEVLGINATINNSEINIFNVYVPPPPSCHTQGYSVNLDPILNFSDDDCFLIGDLNAHHDAWHSPLIDARGRILASSIADSDLIILNV